jgi:hypothetical protein
MQPSRTGDFGRLIISCPPRAVHNRKKDSGNEKGWGEKWNAGTGSKRTAKKQNGEKREAE